jgi:hypothetical protein
MNAKAITKIIYALVLKSPAFAATDNFFFLATLAIKNPFYKKANDSKLIFFELNLTIFLSSLKEIAFENKHLAFQAKSF